MRLTLHLLAPAVSVAALAAPWLQTAHAQARGNRVRREVVEEMVCNPITLPSRAETPKLVVESDYKATMEAAYEAALKEARDRLLTDLKRIKPDTQWEPSLAFIERLVKEKTVRPFVVEDKTVRPYVKGEAVKGDTVYRAELTLVLPYSVREEMLYKIRLEEAKHRQWTLTKGFLGVLALLVAMAGFYQFDDRTKGYYTTWLRVAAAGFLIVAIYSIRHLP
jgi:hypothetical protein